MLGVGRTIEMAATISSFSNTSPVNIPLLYSRGENDIGSTHWVETASVRDPNDRRRLTRLG